VEQQLGFENRRVDLSWFLTWRQQFRLHRSCTFYNKDHETYELVPSSEASCSKLLANDHWTQHSRDSTQIYTTQTGCHSFHKKNLSEQVVVIIIGISSNMCSLNISGLSHENDGHKALICFRCLPLVWNQMDNYNLVVNKEKTQKANIWAAS
jgi:hypothetical protein